MPGAPQRALDRNLWQITRALYLDANAALDDLREAATTLEETSQTARRVLGGTHPLTVEIEDDLRGARAALAARETQSPASA